MSQVCYSWWVLASLAILGRADWIDQEKLARFILSCQDTEKGGIADRPEDMADVWHTIFGTAGELMATCLLYSEGVSGAAFFSCSLQATSPIWSLLQQACRSWATLVWRRSTPCTACRRNTPKGSRSSRRRERE